MDRIKKDIDGTHYQRVINKDILDKIFKNLKWSKSDSIEVLDIGCGPGVVTKDILMPKLPANFKKLIGVDIRHDYISYAKTVYSDEKVTFTKMDIDREPPPEYEERFDLVTSFFCLQLLKHQEQSLEFMAKCVKPGGNFILTFEFRKEYDDFMQEMSQSTKWAEYIDQILPNHMLDDAKESFINIIKGFDFKIIHEELRKCELPKSRVGYMAYLRRVDPFAKKMRPVDQKEYFNYVEENYVNKNLSSENPEIIISKYTMMVVHAVKE